MSRTVPLIVIPFSRCCGSAALAVCVKTARGGVECRSLLTALPSEAEESIGESRKAAKMTAAFPFSLSVGMLEFWLVC